MKKQLIYGFLGIAAVATLTGCDDLLNDNRYPQSIQTSNTEFWSNASNVRNECNYFYELFSGYGNGSGLGEFYAPGLNDNQTSSNGGENLANWKNINVPASSTNWSNPYIYIRRANLIIEGVENSSLTETDKANFIGIARMIRGWQYYGLVRAYGDVPLVETALDPSNPEDYAILFEARTNRNTVMDYALADLDYAIANIGTQKSKNAFSKDLAKAIKSEVCLYEGSYARYHAKDESRATKYFTEAAKAAGDLVDAYPIGDNYQATYNSFRGALSANAEVIFMKEYEKDVFMHSTVDYTSSSTPISGITKDLFDAYLFKDGKPLALTSEDTSDLPVTTYEEKVVDGKTVREYTLDIAGLLAVRDGRLSQTIDPRVYFEGTPYQRPNSMKMTSLTGYGVKKFDNPEMDYTYTTTVWNYTCAPLYWGALVSLDYAEAKAELGTLTDADLDKTVNKMFARAGLPAATVASLSAMTDPANNMKVSNLLWEIRRCRRCELVYDKDLRYWDLVRWHQLELLDADKHPNIYLGANVSGMLAEDRPANVDGYMNAKGKGSRVFSDREYLFPIPSGQIGLNNNLTQNPGWN